MYDSTLSIHNGDKAAAVISDTIVTGHVDICLLDHNNHPIITHTKAVYKPICIGNHANQA